jgi:hypothetical protein
MKREVRKMASNLHDRTCPLRGIRLASLLLGLMCLPLLCHAKNNCAWINESTASGLLGGDAVGEFTEASAGQPAVCTFTQKDAAVTRTLRVTVLVTPDFDAGFRSAAQSCGSDAAPIQAIGNQAIVCAADDRKGGIGQRVVGRVRDQVFTITISSTLKNDPSLTRDTLKARIYTAAEQVSGNLF